MKYAQSSEIHLEKIVVTEQLSLCDCVLNQVIFFHWCQVSLEYMYLSFRIHYLLFITLDIDVIKIVGQCNKFSTLLEYMRLAEGVTFSRFIRPPRQEWALFRPQSSRLGGLTENYLFF